MRKIMKRLWKDEEAVSATEYGIIAAIIAVGLITVLFQFRGALKNMFTRAASAVNTPP